MNQISVKPQKSRRTRLTAATVVAGVALVPMLSGCWNGFNAGTSMLPASGDGLNTEIGNILIRSAVWVQSTQDGRTFTLSANFVNTGTDADQLTGVETSPNSFAIGITNAAITLPPISTTNTGYNATNYINAFGTNNVPVSGYIQTTFIFKTAGRVTGSVMTVPPEGIYAGITPSPSGIPDGPATTGSPSASPSPTVTGSASPTRATASPTATASPS